MTGATGRVGGQVVAQLAGTGAGVRAVGLPSVSILLATRRPDQLAFALAQVAKQRAPDVELVLAPHGFAADPGRVRSVLGEGRVVASVAAIPEGAIAALRFQFVARGLLVEVAVTSSDLAVLGAALPIFEQLAAGITFADASR